MNAASLQQQLYVASPESLAAQLVEAIDALAPAATTAHRLAVDHDRIALGLLERLAERLEGARRLAMHTRAALARDTDPHRIAGPCSAICD
jgi:hypothetical protein